MARQKLVHSSSMVAHLWANKAQDEARVPHGNFYFTGPTIYSYGAHYVIAHHSEAGLLLWNNSSSSMTTNGQKSEVMHALTFDQRQAMVRIPGGMRSDDVCEFDRRFELKDGRLPIIVQKLAEAVIAEVLSIASMRKLEKMEYTLENARRMQADGLKLCAAVSGKKKTKWPVALLPETVPADKLERAAMVRSYSKGVALKEYAAALRCAESFMEDLEAHANNPEKENRWAVKNFEGRMNSVASYLQTAAQKYDVAHGKKSAAVAKLRKQLDAIRPALMLQVEEFKTSCAKYDVRDAMRNVFQVLRNIKTESDSGRSKGNIARELGYYLSKIDSATMGYSIDQTASMVDDVGGSYQALERARRVVAWYDADAYLKAAEREYGAAQTYIAGNHWGDVLMNLKSAFRHWGDAQRHGAFNRINTERFMKLSADMQKLRTRADGEIAAKHADAKRAWLAGEIRSLPYEAGTYARINGESVETNRGAVVPLEHACRLARLARRIIAAGGKEWAQGDGPMVGHLRVNVIRADGSAVIGCHEFDAAESARFLAVLESCAGCATHATTVETVGA